MDRPQISLAQSFGPGSALAERVKLRSRATPQVLLDQTQTVVNKNMVKNNLNLP